MEDFYKVEYNGNLMKYHKVGIDANGTPKWASKSMLDCNQFEDWKIKDVSFDTWSWFNTFTEEYALNEIERVFLDLEEAAKLSKELYDKNFAPHSMYKVVRYFDNIFDRFETGALSKKDAYDKCNSMPRRYLYSYEIQQCKE